jgi:hypothetical protein
VRFWRIHASAEIVKVHVSDVVQEGKSKQNLEIFFDASADCGKCIILFKYQVLCQLSITNRGAVPYGLTNK